MNSQAIIDRTYAMVVTFVREQLTEKTTVGALADAVRTQLENDDGVWIRRAMEHDRHD